MNMIQKLKKSKKGFTLVELLVVLVILAILAAAIIPTMMGFIDKAREESAAAECRSVILAGDVVLNEMYGTDTMGTADAGGNYAIDDARIAEIAALPGVISDVTATAIAGSNPTHYFINAAKYETSNGINYIYAATTETNGTWTRQ